MSRCRCKAKCKCKERRRRRENRNRRQFENVIDRSGNSRVNVENTADSTALTAAISLALAAQFQNQNGV